MQIYSWRLRLMKKLLIRDRLCVSVHKKNVSYRLHVAVKTVLLSPFTEHFCLTSLII